MGDPGDELQELVRHHCAGVPPVLQGFGQDVHHRRLPVLVHLQEGTHVLQPFLHLGKNLRPARFGQRHEIIRHLVQPADPDHLQALDRMLDAVDQQGDGLSLLQLGQLSQRLPHRSLVLRQVLQARVHLAQDLGKPVHGEVGLADLVPEIGEEGAHGLGRHVPEQVPDHVVGQSGRGAHHGDLAGADEYLHAVPQCLLGDRAPVAQQARRRLGLGGLGHGFQGRDLLEAAVLGQGVPNARRALEIFRESGTSLYGLAQILAGGKQRVAGVALPIGDYIIVPRLDESRGSGRVHFRNRVPVAQNRRAFLDLACRGLQQGRDQAFLVVA